MNVIYADYVRAGLALVPIPRGKKGPINAGWNLRESAITKPQHTARINGGNIGLAHAWCSPTPTCAIDVDDYEAGSDWLDERGLSLMALLSAEDAVQIKSGRPNRAKLVYRLPIGIGALPTTKTPGGAIEFRCASHDGVTVQDVLPPSLHPDTGKPYEWNGDFTAIPEIPAALYSLWQTLLTANGTHDTRRTRQSDSRSGDPIFQALSERGLVLRDRRDGGVDITCPFAIEHTGNGGKGDCAYFPPHTGGFATAAIHCLHSHCEHRSFEEYRQALGLGDARERGRTAGERYEPRDNSDWPDPQPIPCSLLPVAAFDEELLPVALRAWVTDVSTRMQCPPDFPAVGAMVALSSLIGRKACIRPKRFDDWQVVPNLWGAIVGRPGVMKSPALAEVMKPLDRLAILASGLHDEAMRDHKIKTSLETMGGKAAEARAQKLMKAGKAGEAEQILIDAADAEAIAPPALRRYKVTDASVEALGEILIENPWGTLAYRDELHGLLRSLDREGQEGSRSFYLQGYDGNQSYTFDRIMRGRNLHIPAVCLSMLGGIQPGKLAAYIHDAVSGGAGDDGLLQRFGMLVWPDIRGEWINVDRWPDTPAKNLAFDTFARLDAMPPGTDPETGEPAPAVYHFSDEAQRMFDDWRRDFEISLRSNDLHPAMESHLAKYRKLVPAIALVCALAEREAQVSETSLLRALAWADFLKSHAARAYAAGTRPATDGAKALLGKIQARVVTDGFRPAEVYLKGWSHLSTPESVHAATRMLCDLYYLRPVEKRQGDTGGRPSVTFQINPSVVRAH